MKLPAPRHESNYSVEKAILARRSVRQYHRREISLEDLAQLLWAAQGLTSDDGYRAVPSAGALYPLETDVVAGQVRGLPAGVYRYRPQTHELQTRLSGDKRSELARASYGQLWMSDAAAMLVLSAVYRRTTVKYSQRGLQYVHMEAGHAGQNVALQALALGLSTVMVGAFEDKLIQKILALAPEEIPLYIIPAGN